MISKITQQVFNQIKRLQAELEEIKEINESLKQSNEEAQEQLNYYKDLKVQELKQKDYLRDLSKLIPQSSEVAKDLLNTIVKQDLEINKLCYQKQVMFFKQKDIETKQINQKQVLYSIMLN